MTLGSSVVISASMYSGSGDAGWEPTGESAVESLGDGARLDCFAEFEGRPRDLETLLALGVLVLFAGALGRGGSKDGRFRFGTFVLAVEDIADVVRSSTTQRWKISSKVSDVCSG